MKSLKELKYKKTNDSPTSRHTSQSLLNKSKFEINQSEEV